MVQEAWNIIYYILYHSMARKYDFLRWYNISDDMICLMICQCDIDEFIWVWHWAARWAQLVRRLMISHNQHMAGWPLLASKVALNSRVQKILNKVDLLKKLLPKEDLPKWVFPTVLDKVRQIYHNQHMAACLSLWINRKYVVYLATETVVMHSCMKVSTNCTRDKNICDTLSFSIPES